MSPLNLAIPVLRYSRSATGLEFISGEERTEVEWHPPDTITHIYGTSKRWTNVEDQLTFAPFARAHPVVLARGRVAAHGAQLGR